MALSAQQQREIRAVFTSVIKGAFDRLNGFSLATHPINPFLAVLVARKPSDLAEYLVSQRVERGLVTSMGMRIQTVARIVGTAMHTSGVAGADLEGRDANLKRHYLMQVKSGPDTVDKDIADSIEAKLNNADNRIRQGGMPPGWVVVKMLGMSYGRAAQRNAWIMGMGAHGFNIDNIGRKFWEFITDDAETFKEVFAIAKDVGETYKNGSGKTLAVAIQDTTDLFTVDIEAAYGDGHGGLDWDKLLDRNM